VGIVFVFVFAPRPPFGWISERVLRAGDAWRMTSERAAAVSLVILIVAFTASFVLPALGISTGVNFVDIMDI
jgi:hypothetical protein